MNSAGSSWLQTTSSLQKEGNRGAVTKTKAEGMKANATGQS